MKTLAENVLSMIPALGIMDAISIVATKNALSAQEYDILLNEIALMI